MARKIEGTIGDKYQLSAILGQGATGIVYAAKNLRSQRRVAIKALHLRAGLERGCPELLRFEQEARIAGSIESPHIVQVLDIEQDPATDLPFLVMELLRGEDVQSLLDRVGPLPVDVALRIAAQACAGLVAAHAAGVIHRDIKPANLFFARREKGQIVVKILDFGIAKIRGIPDGSAGSHVLAAPAVPMTESGQMLGSPLFMSPEQVDGTKHVDVRSDLFSLAVTLFTMLAGKAPHADAKGFHILLRRLLTAPPPPIRTVAHWVPPEVEAFVQKAGAFQREDRFSSAKEMLAALEMLLPNGTDLREDLLIGIGESARSSGEVMGSDPEAPTKKQVSGESKDVPVTAMEPNVVPGEASRGLDPYAATMQAPAEPAVDATLPAAKPALGFRDEPNPAATLPVVSKPALALQATPPVTVLVPVESKPVSALSVEPKTTANRIPIVMVVAIVVITLVVGWLVFAR